MLQQNGFRRALSGVQRTSRKKLPCELCTSPQNGSLGCEKAAEICASQWLSPIPPLASTPSVLLMSVTRLEDGFPLSFPSLQLFHAISTSFLPLPSSFGLGLACPASPTGPRQRSDGRCTLQRRIRRENTNLGLLQREKQTDASSSVAAALMHPKPYRRERSHAYFCIDSSAAINDKKIISTH